MTTKMVVPLNMWVLISNFKLANNLLWCPDDTFNEHLAEFLDQKLVTKDTYVVVRIKSLDCYTIEMAVKDDGQSLWNKKF